MGVGGAETLTSMTSPHPTPPPFLFFLKVFWAFQSFLAPILCEFFWYNFAPTPCFIKPHPNRQVPPPYPEASSTNPDSKVPGDTHGSYMVLPIYILGQFYVKSYNPKQMALKGYVVPGAKYSCSARGPSFFDFLLRFRNNAPRKNITSSYIAVFVTMA